MSRLLRVVASAAILLGDAALLLGWSRRPTVPMQAGERLLSLSVEGLGAIAVVEGSGGRRLVVDGRTVASSQDSQRVAVVLAQLPLILAPEARRVLLIGWGAGAAAASALSHPLRALDAVEASAAVVEGSLLLDSPMGHPFDDSRLSLSIGEPHEFLRAQGPLYDAIICDREPDEALIRLASRRLAPGGLLAARATRSQRDGEEGLRRALRVTMAFLPSVSVWSVLDGQVVLLASKRPSREVVALESAFTRAAPAAWLRPLGLSYPATLLSLEAAGEKTTRDLAWGRPTGNRLLTEVDDRIAPESRERLLLSHYLRRRGRPLQPREYLEILLHPRSAQERSVFRGLLEEWVARYPRDPRAVAFLYVVEEQEGHAERAAALRRRLSALRGRRRGLEGRREIIVPGRL